MGSPLDPVLANPFMGYHEQKWLQSFEECELVLYRRYVDDIICLFNCESDADKFFVFLNQRHPKIKFTTEKQTENQLSFLDLLITSNINNFQTSVYRKKHSIGLYTNYLSFTPFSYKMGLVKTLLHRAFVISSNWSIFYLELSKIKELLEKNIYPNNFIDQQIKQYLHEQFIDKNHKEPSNTTYVSYYKLPYIGNLSTEIKQKIIKHCRYYCKSTNIKILFSPFKVGDLFSVKESEPKYLRSFVVYRFTCSGCNASYIGETTRHLSTRIKEHLEIDSKSHIFKHLNINRNCEELGDTASFEIIDSATSSYRLKLKEAMHITWEKPSLNN